MRASDETPKVRQKRCAHKLKSLLFKEQHLDLLETLLSEVTRQPNHPLQRPLQKALHDLLSTKEDLEKVSSTVKNSPIPLFAEAFNRPSVLAQLQYAASDEDPSILNILAQRLMPTPLSVSSLPLKQFLDLSLATHQKLNAAEQRKNLTEILKQFTPHDWKMLQASLPKDRELLNSLCFPEGSNSPGINRLALNLLYSLPQSRGERPLLYRLIESAPEFEKIAESLLRDCASLAETRRKEHIE